MSRQIILSIQQREKGLIELIKDVRERGFNLELIKGYENQLLRIQAELQRDKEKRKNFNKNLLLRDTTTSLNQESEGLLCRESEVLK